MSFPTNQNVSAGEQARLSGNPLDRIAQAIPELGGVSVTGDLAAHVQSIAESLERLVSPDVGQSDTSTASLIINSSAFSTIVAAINALGVSLQGLGNKKQLGQLRPADTNAASLYTPSAGKKGRVALVHVANTSALLATYRIFVDDDGAVFDESTNLFWDIELGPGKSHVICVDWGMDDSSGNVGVRSSVASALTFTAFGDKEI